MPSQMIDGLEWIEPDVMINGVDLTLPESMTLRVALTVFQGIMSSEEWDEKMKGMYEIHIAKLIELMQQNEAEE